ncbi:MAG: hypothetical protein JNJ45_07950 [Chthonomonas sp.]|nr:hypothetical protein [Chthonomonas sp.]
MTHFIRSTALALATLAILSGCGGGGGGSAAGALNYRTYWTSRVDPGSGTGQSQIVVIRNAAGTSLRNMVLDRTSGDTLSFTGLPTGTVTVESFLYSQTSGDGTLLGSVRTEVEVTGSGAASVQTEVGGTVDSVEIKPGSATWLQTQSKQFYAQAKTSGNAYVFSNADSYVWSTLGGVASINSQGIALGNTVGSGAVRCTHTPSSVTGSAPITIAEFNATRTKWTILVYLNAANDLYSYSDLNVNQMEQVTTGDVRFVVQWKQSQDQFSQSTFDGTRRYLVKRDSNTSTLGSQLVEDMGTEVDMGANQTLRDFIEWGKTNYPSDRVGLIVWNHGSGWSRNNDLAWTRGVSFDDQTGSSIDTWELDQCLTGYHFDFLAWDASLMQMAEIMYEVKDYTDYVIGSEESPPGEGYPYQSVFAPFAANPDATTASLTKGFVDGMVNNPPYASRKITQSVIDTSKLPALASAVRDYKTALIANANALTAPIPAARAITQNYSGRTFYDLRHFIQRLSEQEGTPNAVKTAGAAVEAAAVNAILWEGHNSVSPNSKGISIELGASSQFTSRATDYARLKWATDSQWGQFLLQAP